MSDNTDQLYNDDPKYFMADVYKKWHARGFISVKFWPSANKVQIEIAKTHPDTAALESLSKSYLDVFSFLAYLYAETTNTLDIIHPNFAQQEYQSYGGSKAGGKIISRSFKAGYWRSGKDSPQDPSKRSFRCTVSNGKLGPKGAILPDNSQIISFDFIQMKMNEIAELYQALFTIVIAYGVQRADQVVVFND